MNMKFTLNKNINKLRPTITNLPKIDHLRLYSMNSSNKSIKAATIIPVGNQNILAKTYLKTMKNLLQQFGL